MQQPPTGIGHAPQWYGQAKQPLPPNEQWVQQPYIPYPPQQGYPPQQPYPPQQGQFQQPITPNSQWSQQPYWQTPPPPQTPKKKNKLLVIVGAIIVVVFIFMVGIGVLSYYGDRQSNSSTLSEPEYKATAIDTSVEDIDKVSNQIKGTDVHFTATILSFVKDSSGNTAGANVDDGITSGIIQVIFPSGTDLSRVNTGDTIEVWGVDQGSFSGTNGFGATVQEVAVSAVYMTDHTTTYQTA